MQNWALMFFHPNLQITVLYLSNFLGSDFFPSLLHVRSAAADTDRDSRGMTHASAFKHAIDEKYFCLHIKFCQCC